MGFDGGLEENVVEVYYCIFMHKKFKNIHKTTSPNEYIKNKRERRRGYKSEEQKKHWSTKWLTSVDIDVLKKETNLSG